MKKFSRFAAAAFLVAAMFLFTACSGEEAAVQEASQGTECSLAGHYTLCAYADENVTGSEEELEQLGFTDTIYLTINSDGTGELAMDEEGTYALTVDEKSHTFKIDNGESLPYSTTDSKLVVTTNTNLILTFKKADEDSVISDSISSAITEMLGSKECSIADFYSLNTMVLPGGEVLDRAALETGLSIDEWYININSDGSCEFSAGAGGVESGTVAEESDMSGTVTDALGDSYSYYFEDSELVLELNTDDILTLGFVKQDSASESADIPAEYSDLATVDYWYGWISDEDNNSYDVWGVLGTDEVTGRPYLELFEDVNGDPVFSAFVSIDYETGLVTPEIGEGDAWLYDTTLTADDTNNCFIYYEEGELACGFNTNGEQGFEILAIMRPEGAEWPEDELLPPGMRE